jgi:hypothetical protein
LLKPVLPLSPVTVKDTVVDVADWFVAIVTLDTWELVTFPQIARSTIAPLSVVAGTVVAVGVGAGVGVAVGEGEGDGVGVAVGVAVGVGVGVGVSA